MNKIILVKDKIKEDNIYYEIKDKYKYDELIKLEIKLSDFGESRFNKNTLANT